MRRNANGVRERMYLTFNEDSDMENLLIDIARREQVTQELGRDRE